jgi:uncharacterized OsmC-like protein
MNPYTWTLRVTSPDRHTARVTTRRQQFAVTRPVNFDVEHDGISALEYALGALAAELVTGLREFAHRRRVDLDDLEAVVTGELKNPLTYLEVMGEEGDPSISRVHIKLYVTSREPEPAVQALFRQAVELLPLARTFRDLVRLDLQFVHTP